MATVMFSVNMNDFFPFFYIKRALTKRKQKRQKKNPLVARPCKEDSRRNKARGGVRITLEVS